MPAFVPGQIENSDAAALLLRWAELDPAAAIAYAAAHEEQHGQPSLLIEMFDRWLDRDAAAAQRWLAEQPPGPLRNSLDSFRRVAPRRHRSKGGAADGGGIIGRRSPPRTQAVFSQWSGTRSDPAASQALALPDLNDRVLAVESLISNWSSDDLPGAIQWTLGLPLGPERSAGLRSLVPEWTAADPRAAVAALSALPDESERSQSCARRARSGLRAIRPPPSPGL